MARRGRDALVMLGADLLAARVLPPKSRAALLRAMGLDVHATARISSRVRLIDGVELRMAAHAFLNTGCLISAKALVDIRENVFVGPAVQILTTTHLPGDSSQRAGEWVGLPIVIEEGSWIGASATILAGAVVPSGSVVAAGSVVTPGLTQPDTLYGGVPARLIKKLDS